MGVPVSSRGDIGTQSDKYRKYGQRLYTPTLIQLHRGLSYSIAQKSVVHSRS